MRFSKWMRIFKSGFIGIFCIEMKFEFLFSIMCTFGHNEKVDLFVCFALNEMRANKCFFNRLPNCFSMSLDSDNKILPLCYKHVIAMSCRKIRGNLTRLSFQKFV